MSDKGKGGSTGGERPRSMQPMPVQGEQHVPVRDFNAAEVKDFLKKRMSQLSKFPVLVLCLLKKEAVEVTYDSAFSSSTNNFSNLQANFTFRLSGSNCRYDNLIIYGQSLLVRMFLTHFSYPDQPSPYHKAEGDSVAKRYSGAWSSKGMSLSCLQMICGQLADNLSYEPLDA